MSVQKVVQTQRDFSAGEIDPRAARRDDTKIMRAALRRCRNMLPIPTGGAKRRGGFRLHWTGAGRVTEARPTPDRPFWIEFLPETFRARASAVTGVVHTNITGCPWTAADIPGLQWSISGTTMMVTHRDGVMRPQVFTYSIAADAWSKSAFAFDLSLQGEKRQPYHRFAETLGITMQPSARTGSVTVTFSAGVLKASVSEAFPAIAASATSSDTSGTSHSFDLPSGISSGHLLVAVVSARRVTGDGSLTLPTPSGWERAIGISYFPDGFFTKRLEVFYRIATGAEGSSVAFSTSTSCFTACVCHRITNHGGQVWAGTIEGGNYTIERTKTPNPPSLTTPWTVAPTLWIAAACKTTSITGAPTNYATPTTATASTGLILATARRNLTAVADDPGVFAGSSTSTESAISFTIAVKPATQPTGGHVGARFLYVDKELEITAITSPTEGTATVIDKLPPSQTLTSESGGALNFASFAVGEIVEGETSGARGEVVTKGSDTSITVQLYTQQNGFQNSENVVGPKATAKLTSSGAGSLSNPGAILNWKEELVNDLRGWPGSVTMDRQRVTLTRLKQFPQAVMWSAIRTIGNFAITAEPDSAMFEYVPGDVSVEMLMDGPDQFVLTDRGIYYIPISAGSPLAAGSVEFRLVTSDGAASIRPVWTPQGMIFVSAKGGRVLTLVPTGQTARPYTVEDISTYHSHLINDPMSIAAIGASENSPERLIYVVMGDGTIAVARYDRTEEWVGWFPWEFDGNALEVAAQGQTLMARFAHGATLTVEELSPSHRLDFAIENGSPLLSVLEGDEVDVYGDERYLGTRTVESGSIETAGAALPVGSYAGRKFVPEVAPFAPNVGEGESIKQRLRRRKISKFAVTVQDTTGFNIGSKVIANYRAGENEEEAPPRRDDTYGHRPLKREFEPEVEITQPVPGDLTITEIAMEISV